MSKEKGAKNDWPRFAATIRSQNTQKLTNLQLEFSFAKFCAIFAKKAQIFAFFKIHFARINNTLCNLSQASFHPKLHYVTYALFCFVQFCGPHYH